MARLANQLDGDQPRAAMLRDVEESLERLQSRLSESHRESIEAARAEARAAVGELSASLDERGINADLIRALRQDLDNLRAATEVHAAHAGPMPEVVDQTLTQVVDRLDRLERATVEEERATGTHGPEITPPAQGVAPVVTPPQKTATGDRRADFIAAARRAAQAAAAEAHRVEATRAEAPADEDEDEEHEHKPGAFSRISQAIRNRKRPLLLAAAAIVLAIGALKVYSTYTSAPAQMAAAEPSVSIDTAKSPVDDVLAAAGAAPATVSGRSGCAGGAVSGARCRHRLLGAIRGRQPLRCRRRRAARLRLQRRAGAPRATSRPQRCRSLPPPRFPARGRPRPTRRSVRPSWSRPQPPAIPPPLSRSPPATPPATTSPRISPRPPNGISVPPRAASRSPSTASAASTSAARASPTT